MIVASDPAQADRPARITVRSGAVGLFLAVSCYRGKGSSELTLWLDGVGANPLDRTVAG